MRTSLPYALVVVLFILGGCQKSDQPPEQAVTAKGGLMPSRSPEPRGPVSALADQKQVKVIERTVSYEPLDTFIAKNAATAEKATGKGEKKTATADKKTGKAKKEKVAAKPAAEEPASQKKGLFSKMKGGLGSKLGGLTNLGGPGASGSGTPPPKAAGKGKEGKTGAKAKKTDEGDEQGSDEPEAKDESDEEDEAKDADEEESDEDSADDGSGDEAEEDDGGKDEKDKDE